MKHIKVKLLCGLLCAFSLTACEQLQAVKDAISSPEDIVVDYAMHLSDIMNSTAKCDELESQLKKYCSSREEVVTKAVSETVTRIKNNEIKEEKQREIESKLKSISDTNFTSCLLNPGVAIQKLSCLKPMIAVTDAL